MQESNNKLLAVQDLAVGFLASSREQQCSWAVDGVSFGVNPGQSCCLVGESGCGKSVSALALMGLLPAGGRVKLAGEVLFEGRDLLLCERSVMDGIRGKQVGMVFQEPMTSLNPVLKIGDQLAEPLRLHLGMGRQDAWGRAVQMLEKVGIRQAAQRARDYPHQLSGGMRQRVMIAMAMICNPRLLIADEPTTALDVSLQGQILDLMREMQGESGSALLMITHDFDVVAHSATYMYVMYSGKIVESGPVSEVLAAPAHPYTIGLMASRPRMDPSARHGRLKAIPGNVPSPLSRPSGCVFSPRCAEAFGRCEEEMPALLPLSSKPCGDSRYCRCWKRI